MGSEMCIRDRNKAPDVEIKIDVEHSSSIEKREIDGVTYLLVPLSATSDI